MDDNIIEICDNEINVEKTMETIRENTRRRKTAGGLFADSYTLISTPSRIGVDNTSIQSDLNLINTNWDINNTRYVIRSHRPFIGPILVRGRWIVHGEVRRYIDPMISRQTDFNASLVRIINQISQEYTELNKIHQNLDADYSTFKQKSDKRITDSVALMKKELESDIDSKIKEQVENLEQVREDFIALLKTNTGIIRQELNVIIETNNRQQQLILNKNREEIDREISSSISCIRNEFYTKFDPERVDGLIKELYAHLDENIHTRAWIVHALEERLQKEVSLKRTLPDPSEKEELNYLHFEERFRGSRDQISQRQMAFLQYFMNSSLVLDIGCGRGEFLEILKNHNIRGIGVDNDPDMVTYSRSRNLKVENSDALKYLEKLEDGCLEGIFIDQVIEHLDPAYLIRLLSLCYQKLKSGYYIVIETVNPLSFVSFANFYIDMTHKRPVHPETLQYLFSVAGFRDIEKKFFTPVPDEFRLKSFTPDYEINEKERKNIEIYNYNVNILNSMLFGAQDYAIIGKK